MNTKFERGKQRATGLSFPASFLWDFDALSLFRHFQIVLDMSDSYTLFCCPILAAFVVQFQTEVRRGLFWGSVVSSLSEILKLLY